MPSRYPDAYAAMLRRLKRARQDAGLSQTAAGEALGWVQTEVSKIERGERRLDPVELKAFADLYMKPVDYFLEGADPGT